MPVATYGILECIDNAEYAALSADNKILVNTLLGCSLLDMSTGSKAKTLLLAIFPEGTATNTAIGQLIGDSN
jgi:hypothetical protein